jgi:hypothetical protein
MPSGECRIYEENHECASDVVDLWWLGKMYIFAGEHVHVQAGLSLAFFTAVPNTAAGRMIPNVGTSLRNCNRPIP